MPRTPSIPASVFLSALPCTVAHLVTVTGQPERTIKARLRTLGARPVRGTGRQPMWAMPGTVALSATPDPVALRKLLDLAVELCEAAGVETGIRR